MQTLSQFITEASPDKIDADLMSARQRMQGLNSKPDYILTEPGYYFTGEKIKPNDVVIFVDNYSGHLFVARLIRQIPELKGWLTDIPASDTTIPELDRWYDIVDDHAVVKDFRILYKIDPRLIGKLGKFSR